MRNQIYLLLAILTLALAGCATGRTLRVTTPPVEYSE